MFTDIQLEDYGLILLALAAFGFIVSDAYNMGRYWGIPINRNDIEKVFHYIANGIIAIVVIFVMFLYFIINYPISPVTVDFTSYIQKVGITSDILLGLFYFTLIYSVLYILTFLVGFYLSLVFHYIKALWINVYFIDNTNKKFAGFITESKDFFFFQKDELLWEAIRKDRIMRIETIKDKSRIEKSGIDKRWHSFYSKFIEDLHDINQRLIEDLHPIYKRITEDLHKLKK